MTDVADLLAAPAPPEFPRELAGRGLIAGLVAEMVSDLGDRAAADLDALGTADPGSDALGAIRAHFLHAMWQLLGSHVRDQSRIWQASRPVAPGSPGQPAVDGAGFAAYMRADGGTAMLERLPGLEPLVASVARLEVQATATLLARAAGDADALGAQFGGDRHLGPLIDASLGLSDPHNRRSAVAALSFAGGVHVVCKPRPVAMERGLSSAVDWLRLRSGLDLPAGLAVLERDGYGWCEFVQRRPCARREDVDLYFRRLGVLAGVLEALAATDCHADNFIARGAEPILVDAETLLHPRMLASPGFSLRETEIVPSRVRGPSGQTIDYPGFDRAPAAQAPDLMTATNLPCWSGRVHHLRDHHRSFEAGVDLTRQTLRDLGDELTDADGPLAALADRPARVVLRPTAMYGALLAHLTSARALHSDDGGWPRVERELRRYQDPVLSPEVWHVVQRAELDALARTDVPYFLADTGTGDLRTADGTVLAHQALEPVLKQLPAARRFSSRTPRD